MPRSAHAANPQAMAVEGRAKTLYQSQKYADAFAAFKQGAEMGDAMCQDWLGFMYMNGIGVAKDDAQAFAWNRKAAEQGLALAEFNLGWKYQYGIGVPEDLVLSVEWYQKAAAKGDAYAENSLGYMYQNGLGIGDIDYEKAVAWYTKAAQQGYANAETNLGYMYLEGLGVDKDRKQAGMWFQKAAEQKELNAKGFLEQMNSVPLTAAQMQDAAITIMTVPGYPLAPFDPTPLTADQQDQAAQTMTTEEMYGLAALDMPALTQRATAGNVLAQYVVAQRYHYGAKGAPKDQSQADAWLKKAMPVIEHASKLGNPVAEYIQGDLYLEGEFYAKDTAKGIEELRAAAELGNVPAFNMLGYCYRYGLRGLPLNLGESGFWFHTLASYGPNGTHVYKPRPDSFVFPDSPEILAKQLAAPPEVHGSNELYVFPPVSQPGSFGLSAGAAPAKPAAWTQQPVVPEAPGTYGAPAMNCVTEGRDNVGVVTFKNECSYKIHIVWTPTNPGDDDQPAYSTYLNPEQMIITEFATGPYKLYSCAFDHLMVGPDGKPVTKAVEDFRCLKM